jgi:hypothetical protein
MRLSWWPVKKFASPGVILKRATLRDPFFPADVAVGCLFVPKVHTSDIQILIPNVIVWLKESS